MEEICIPTSANLMVCCFSREMDEGTGIIDNQVNNNLQHYHSLSFVLVKGPYQIDRQLKGIECCMQFISFISTFADQISVTNWAVIFTWCLLIIQDMQRLEKYLNLEGFLEISLKIKSALKSTGSHSKALNSP